MSGIDIKNGRQTLDKIFDLLDEPVERLLPQIHAYYTKNGFVVLRCLSPGFCLEAIQEQVQHILLKQPWKEELKLKVHKMVPTQVTRNCIKKTIYRPTAEIINFETHPSVYVENLIKAPIEPKTLDSYNNAWTLHKSFGACSDDAVFHLPHVWDVRQNPHLFQVAKKLLKNNDNLWVDINRSIQKLPKMGEDEFLHWDLDMFSEYSEDQGIQGKVAYTDSQFVCVPGTHTKAFHAEFNEKYRPLYPPSSKKKVAKFNFDQKKEDPLELKDKACTFLLPAGCVLFWSSHLLHGQKKTPTDAPIEFGMYLGYMPAIDRPEYETAAKNQRTHIDKRFNGIGYLNNGRPLTEAADRIYSYKNGVAPILWPSLDPIHFYPYQFESTYGQLEIVLNKMSDEAKDLYETKEYTIGQKKEIRSILPWKNEGYIPYPLTDLGKKLLGLEAPIMMLVSEPRTPKRPLQLLLDLEPPKQQPLVLGDNFDDIPTGLMIQNAQKRSKIQD